MRNLKRVLSLALASVMLMGMMVMGAGAAESTTYSDQNSIKNKEAVAVMSAVGVFQGADGKFNPTGNLTRESAAKIITYMVMGKTSADGLATSAAPFKDVAADRWSAGSISYCVANGIISGDGQGSFFPEMTINGYAFAKMLLVALGYNATTEKLVGTGWEPNVAKLVSTLKLASGVDVGLSAVLTREQAAQMALNTIQANLVEYTGGISYTGPDGSSMTSGGTRQTVKDGNGNAITFAKNNMPNLKKSTTSGEVFGRPAHMWKNGATTIGTYGDSSSVTYTATAKASAIKDDMSGYDFTGANVITNGTKTTLGAPATGKTDADTVAALTGAGRQVEIYGALVSNTVNNVTTESYKVTDIVVVDTYLAQITAINTTGKIVSLSIKDGGSAQVKNEDDAALYTVLAAMAKEDYVLVTKTGATVRSVAEVETMTGALKSIDKDNNLVIDGTTYNVTKGKTFTVAPGTTYTFYMDAYGNVIFATEEKGTEAKNAFVLATDRSGGASSGFTYLTKVLFEDGTQEWVETASLDKVGTKETAFWANLQAAENSFVTYSVKTDRAYALTTVPTKGNTLGSTVDDSKDATGYALSGAANVITKNTVNFLTGSDLMGTSKTIFLVKNSAGGNETYKAYTGITNISNFSSVGGYVLVAKTSKTASMVIINSSTATAKDVVYLLSSKAGAGYDDDLGAPVYTYDAIVKGVVTTITTTGKNTAGTATGGTALTKGLYTIDTYSGDYAKTLTPIATHTDKKDGYIRAAESISITSGTVTVANNGGSYVLIDECPIIAVDKDGAAVPVSSSDVEYYATSTTEAGGNKITDTTLTFNADGFVTSIIFQYVAVPATPAP